MKPTTLLLIFTFFAMPGIVYAESPFSSLQSAVLIHEKYEKNREDIGLFGI